MVFQEFHFVDNCGLREINEVAWDIYDTIKVEVATCCPASSYKTCK